MSSRINGTLCFNFIVAFLPCMFPHFSSEQLRLQAPMVTTLFLLPVYLPISLTYLHFIFCFIILHVFLSYRFTSSYAPLFSLWHLPLKQPL